MKLKSVMIPERDLQRLQELVDKHYYPNVSEAIRHAVKDLIEFHERIEERRKQ